MNRSRISIFVGFLLLCIGGVIGYLFYPLGVRVTVRNAGQEMMRDVTVKVTGRLYTIGDIPAGSSRSQRVSPTSESHVEVEFTDEQEVRICLNAGGYIEPGYRGQIELEIRDGGIIATHDEVRSGIY